MSEISTYISSGPSVPTRPGSPGKPQAGRRVDILDQDVLAAEPADEQPDRRLEFDRLLRDATQLKMRDLPVERDVRHAVEEPAVLPFDAPAAQQRGQPINLLFSVLGETPIGEKLHQGAVGRTVLRRIKRARRLGDQPFGFRHLAEPGDGFFGQAGKVGLRFMIS